MALICAIVLACLGIFAWGHKGTMEAERLRLIEFRESNRIERERLAVLDRIDRKEWERSRPVIDRSGLESLLDSADG